MTNSLLIYSRLGCHLCDEMQSLLPDYLDGTGISFDIVYVEDDSKLEAQYGTLVPVLKAGNREICHYFLDVKALQQYISEQGNPLN